MNVANFTLIDLMMIDLHVPPWKSTNNSTDKCVANHRQSGRVLVLFLNVDARAILILVSLSRSLSSHAFHKTIPPITYRTKLAASCPHPEVRVERNVEEAQCRRAAARHSIRCVYNDRSTNYWSGNSTEPHHKSPRARVISHLISSQVVKVDVSLSGVLFSSSLFALRRPTRC